MKDMKNNKLQRCAKRLYALFACLVLALAVMAVPAFAASSSGNPLAVVNKLSEFIFSLIRAVGLILLGYGVLQVGLSLQSYERNRVGMFLELLQNILYKPMPRSKTFARYHLIEKPQ